MASVGWGLFSFRPLTDLRALLIRDSLLFINAQGKSVLRAAWVRKSHLGVNNEEEL
jgi:hypothetical protein